MRFDTIYKISVKYKPSIDFPDGEEILFKFGNELSAGNFLDRIVKHPDVESAKKIL